MTETINPTLTKIEDLVKLLIFDAVLEAQLNAFFIAAPWLNFWPIRQILSGIARMLVDRFYSGLKLFIDVKAIKFLNEDARKDFDNAAVVLAIIAEDKGIDSDEFKKSRLEAKKHFHDLVVYHR